MSEPTFTCCDCGKEFVSWPAPAETRRDDPEPRCWRCIEKMMDSVDAEPLSEETIQRILSKVKQRVFCTWTWDDIHEYYDASCGEAWCLVDGTPEENHYRFCPGCGKRIKIVPQALEEC